MNEKITMGSSKMVDEINLRILKQMQYLNDYNQRFEKISNEEYQMTNARIESQIDVLEVKYEGYKNQY